MKYFMIYLLANSLMISLPTATFAGCPLDIQTIYEIQNVTCEGEACEYMVIRNDDGGTANVYYETSNCSACYTIGRFGDVTKCSDRPECNLVAINHYASCGGGYSINFTRASLGESFYGDNGNYIETPLYTKADLESSTHISKQIEDTTIEFDLVPTGERIEEPTQSESFSAVPGQLKLYYFVVPVFTLVVMTIFGIWFFKHKK